MKKKFLTFMVTLMAVLAFGSFSHAALTEADFSGDYHWIWMGTGEYPLEFSSSTLAFNGEGGWSMSFDNDDPDNSGTYAIDDEGLFSLRITEPETQAEEITSDGAVSRDANLIVIPEITEEPGLSILVKESTSAADLSGTRYNFAGYSVSTVYGLQMGTGFIEFDESSLTYNEEFQGEVNYTDSDIGYSVSASGKITFGDSASRTGFISPNGNFIVVTDREEGEILFMVKSSAVEEDALSGRYHLAAWDYDLAEINPGPVTENGFLVFDGNGNWIYPDVEEEGSYSIEENGRLAINAEPALGTVSPDGSIAIKPDMDSNEVGIAFLLKAPAAISTVTDIKSENAVIDETKTTTEAMTGPQIEETHKLSNFEPVAAACSITAAPTNSGEVAVFGYTVGSLFGKVADLQLIKLKPQTTLKFAYAAADKFTSGTFEDGDWWLTDSEGNYLKADDALNATKTYTVNYAVLDNGDYDLDERVGTIEDPTVLGTEAESTAGETDGDADNTSGADDGSGDSSGCFIHSLSIR